MAAALLAAWGEAASREAGSAEWPLERIVGGVYAGLLVAGLVSAFALAILAVQTHRAWGPRVRRLLWRPWPERAGLWLVALLLLIHGAYLTAYGRLVLVSPERGEALAGPAAVLQSALFHGFILVFAGLVLRRRAVAWSDAFGLGRAGLGRRLFQGAGVYLAALPAVVLCALAAQWLLRALGREVRPQDVLNFFTDEYPAAIRGAFLFIGIVAAPWAEEVLFRGVALPFLARRIGPSAGALAVSALFAGLHFNLAAFLPLLAFGLVLAGAYLRTGSLWVPIAAHVCFNGVNLALLHVLT